MLCFSNFLWLDDDMGGLTSLNKGSLNSLRTPTWRNSSLHSFAAIDFVTVRYCSELLSLFLVSVPLQCSSYTKRTKGPEHPRRLGSEEPNDTAQGPRERSQARRKSSGRKGRKGNQLPHTLQYLGVTPRQYCTVFI